MSERGYDVPSAPARGELKEKGSRFLAEVHPVGDEESARARLATLGRSYSEATHLCWAWRLGDPARERSSDAGEPAGTAGMPILQVLRGSELSDLLLVVARFFGGVKLGKGGLARAYSGAAREALEGVRRERRFPKVRLRLQLDYQAQGAVKRLIQPPEVELVVERYGEEVELELLVARYRLTAFQDALAALGVTVVKVSD